MKPFRRMAELAMAALLVVALGHRDGSNGIELTIMSRITNR